MEALSGAVEHIAAAVASKVETSVGEVVDRATVQLKECGVVVKGNQADAQGEVADFFIQRAPRKLRRKENEKREGKEKERERGGVRASWKLSGVLKKEQKLFFSTLRFSDFQNFPRPRVQ